MRLVKAVGGALALFAMLLLPGARSVRADDYNKLTYFTFSGPVQVPGVTLAAGTYMFKLADPESGRRAIQIWNKDGSKLYTTLLTMTNEKMDTPKEPMVMFNEQPAGEAPAVRVWYYEGVRAGYEFIYPKDQAMKIAKASHSPVLAWNDNSSTDASAIKPGSVGHIDDSGQFTAEASTSSTTAASASSNATPVNSSASSSSSSATTTTASATDSQADQSTGVAATSGTDRVQVAENLPRTASPLPLFELMSGLSFLGALGVRQLRQHVAERR